MPKKKFFLVWIGLVCWVFAYHQAYAYTQPNNSTFIFAPEDALYVDRDQPTTYFGGQQRVVVRDWIGAVVDPGSAYPANTTTYYNEVDVARTFIKFNTDELTGALNNYDITSATLVMRLSNITDGNINKAESINVRQVTSASALDYIKNLTWDLQSPPNSQNNNLGRDVKFGNIFATQDFNTGELLENKFWTSAGSRELSQLADGWRNATIANYGVVLEDDFDADKWAELVNATLYSVDHPEEMDELEVIFAKGNTYYPYLQVSVTPKVVPEPLSCALMLLGSGVLGLAAKRKKRT